MSKNKERLLLISLVCVFAFTTLLLAIPQLTISSKTEDAVIKETGDEISRAKFFIKDWYDELSVRCGEPEVYFNELRFQGGAYTLTVASDRVRAVYPRGERFFQLEHITYIEFYKENGSLLCRLYYHETGEYIFKLS